MHQIILLFFCACLFTLGCESENITNTYTPPPDLYSFNVVDSLELIVSDPESGFNDLAVVDDRIILTNSDGGIYFLSYGDSLVRETKYRDRDFRVQHITTDGTNVFFPDSSGNRIYKMTKDGNLINTVVLETQPISVAAGDGLIATGCKNALLLMDSDLNILHQIEVEGQIISTEVAMGKIFAAKTYESQSSIMKVSTDGEIDYEYNLEHYKALDISVYGSFVVVACGQLGHKILRVESDALVEEPITQGYRLGHNTQRVYCEKDYIVLFELPWNGIYFFESIDQLINGDNQGNFNGYYGMESVGFIDANHFCTSDAYGTTLIVEIVDG